MRGSGLCALTSRPACSCLLSTLYGCCCCCCPPACLPCMQAWDQNVFNEVAHDGLLPFQRLPESDRLVS